MFTLFLCTCDRAQNPHPPDPRTTFYHWQTHLNPDSTARSLLAWHGSDRLYVKAFDVVWRAGQPEPTAVLEVADTVGLPRLVPVIFITNEVFEKYPAYRLPELAEDMLGLTRQLLGPNPPELQIDCDWTAGTRQSYFIFLKALRQLLAGTALTCTLRLHQYKAPDRQGVPPVDRATLMAYNVGDLNDWQTVNSIVDTNETKKYLAGAGRYPLDLDLAVAVYDWAAVYRHDRLAYLINEPDLNELADTSRFRRLTEVRYEVTRSTYLDGIYLYQGDLLRHEVVPPAALETQTKLLRRYVPGNAGQRVMVYRLGSRLWRDAVSDSEQTK